MPLGSEPLRIAIAGAASLRGRDLTRWQEESGFPAGEIRLLDEEFAAGTLTELGGEPAVVQTVDETSFDRMHFVFFAGTPQFAARHGAAAQRAGAVVIDLTGGLAASEVARPWIPRLDSVLPTPPPSRASNSQLPLFSAPSTPAIVACSLAAAFAGFPLARLAVVFFQPVSEREQAGIDELEAQTAKLLALQPIPQEVFDTQVAFNLLDRWGGDSAERLSDVRTALAREVHGYLAGRAATPAITLIQAPVFYGHAFSCYAEFAALQSPESLAEHLTAAGFSLAGENDPGPSNASVAGEAHAAIGRGERDSNVPCGYWFWGAADNLRVATANATRIAESLLAS